MPRVFEKVYNAASHKAGAGWKGRLFVKAAEAARVWSRKEQAGEQHTFAEIAERAKYETLVYRTVRGALGPKIKYVACGGAPLSLDLAHFYNGIGLPMIQGYGMTETAAPFAATRVTDNVIGTVGQPAPGSSIRISDEGELQVKGPNVFRGYHNLPEKTAEAFTADGWLRTGDLAEIDDEGHIVITGRIKDIIITAGGKNVSPIPLEEEIAKCPIVEHCVVVGDQRPFIGALVTLDPESLALWLPAHGLSTETPVDRRLRGQAVRGQPQCQRLRIERHQRADERALVAHHHAVLHDRALGDLFLQRNGGDVLAAGSNNNVLDAAGDDDVALIIDLGQVAGPEPAVGGERLGRLLRQIVVAAEHVRALDLQFAFVGNANRGAGRGLAYGADHIVGHARGGERGGGFGHAITLNHRQSDAVVEMRQIERQWCAAAGHVLDLRAQSTAHRAVNERFVLGALGDFGKRVLLAGLLLAAPDARGLGGLDKQAALPAGTGLVRGGVVYLLEHARHAQQVGRLSAGHQNPAAGPAFV